MASNRRYELGVGCLLLGAMAVLAFMALELGALSQLVSETTDVTAEFGNAAGLQVGAVVSIAGVPVGKVTGMAVDQDVHSDHFGAAVVSLALDTKSTVGRGSTVRIRMRSLLGEKYVEVLPGPRDAPAVQDGDRLAVDGEQLEIDELIAKLGPLIDGIDPKEAGKVIAALADALQKDPDRLSRMLDNADRLLANGATASDQLPQLMADGSATLGQARSTLAVVDARARQGGDLMAHADTVLDDVSTSTSDLPALVGDAQGLLSDGKTLVGSLQERQGQLQIVLDNFSKFDTLELRRLLREDGILVRLKRHDVDSDEGSKSKRHGNSGE